MFYDNSLYISTLSFSLARTSSFLTCPRKGSERTQSPTHSRCTLANLVQVQVQVQVQVRTWG